MKRVIFAILVGLWVVSTTASDTAPVKRDVHFMGCYWRVPVEFNPSGNEHEYYSRLQSGILSTIQFKKEAFNKDVLKSKLVIRSGEKKYGDLTVYRYRFNDTQGKELGFSGMQFPLVTVSRTAEHITFSNLSYEEVRVIGADCFSGL
jgi:hypothetical protein